MPTYEYECEQCLERFERITSMANRHEATHCGQKARLRISHTSVVMLTPLIVLQEHPESEGGGYIEIDRINNAPNIRPCTEPKRDLSEV